MPYDYDNTHERILKSAMRHFLEVGFRAASIRSICRDAGVTNGAFYSHFESKEQLFSALVGDCVSGFTKAYDDLADMTIRGKEDIVRILGSAYSSIETLIHYIYENSERFMLVFKCGGGSAYENFVDELIDTETRNTMVFLQSCRDYMSHPENISERIAGGFSNLAIRQAIDAFTSGISEEENIRATRLASDFCIAGYRATLGF